MLQISVLRKTTYLTLWKIFGIGMESGQKNGFCWRKSQQKKQSPAAVKCPPEVRQKTFGVYYVKEETKEAKPIRLWHIGVRRICDIHRICPWWVMRLRIKGRKREDSFEKCKRFCTKTCNDRKKLPENLEVSIIMSIFAASEWKFWLSGWYSREGQAFIDTTHLKELLRQLFLFYVPSHEDPIEIRT